MNDHWWQKAACRGQASRVGNYKVFFPVKEEERLMARARKLCDQCQVRLECLDYAIALDILDGIWGGRTVEERDQVVRFRRHRRLVV